MAGFSLHAVCSGVPAGHTGGCVPEGEKTIGLELSVQSGWDPPEVVAFPLGSAGCLLGSYKGFNELRELGLISRFSRKPSFSTTLMHEEPVSGNLALQAIRMTGGVALAASDDEVRRAMGILGETGCVHFLENSRCPLPTRFENP
jgi:threonine synthase